MSSVTGTPDYQHGVVNPQKQYATQAGTSTTATIGLPSNCRLLYVFVAVPSGDATPPIALTAKGLITTTPYQVVYIYGTQVLAYAVFVNEAVDSSVVLTWNVSPGYPWYVVADTAPVGTIDMALATALGTVGNEVQSVGVNVLGSDSVNSQSLRTNQQGQLYVVSAIPDTATGDHPPNELTFYSGTWSSFPATVLDAPVAGERIRLFSLQMSAGSGVVDPYVYVNVTGGAAIFKLAALGNGNLLIPPQGIALPEVSGVGVNIDSGTGSVSVSVVYTNEYV